MRVEGWGFKVESSGFRVCRTKYGQGGEEGSSRLRNFQGIVYVTHRLKGVRLSQLHCEPVFLLKSTPLETVHFRILDAPGASNLLHVWVSGLELRVEG